MFCDYDELLLEREEQTEYDEYHDVEDELGVEEEVYYE